MRVDRLTSVLFGALLAASGSAFGQGAPLPEAPPDSAGFSADRLKHLDEAVGVLDFEGPAGRDCVAPRPHLGGLVGGHPDVEAGVADADVAGIVTMLARHGKLVEAKTYGQQDLASAKPMPKDAIFRIYSMTKPITGVAMMILYEEGKWKPGDPLSKYIPEFAGLKVYAGTDRAGKPILAVPAHAPTVGEVMSHTAGFTYGFFGSSPVDKLYMASNPLSAPSLDEFIARLARLPLVYQPGEEWLYSVAVDVQGYLVEKLSGKPFPDFVRERLFKPFQTTKRTGMGIGAYESHQYVHELGGRVLVDTTPGE